MKKRNSLLTDEKMQWVKDHPKTYKLSNLIALIAKGKEKINDKKSELSLDTVLNICAETSYIHSNLIRGKKNYQYSLIQNTFYMAAYCYTGFSINDIAEYSGCQWRTVWNGIDAVKWCLKDERKFVVMAVLLECEKLSGNRVFKNIQAITIEQIKSMGAEVDTIENPIMFMEQHRINDLPFRNEDWFKPTMFNKAITVLAYRNDAKSVYSIVIENDTIAAAVYQLQQFGYRFCAYGQCFLHAKGCKNCSLGMSGKCPAAVKESYFCPRREYKVEPSAMAGVTIAQGKSFREYNKN